MLFSGSGMLLNISKSWMVGSLELDGWLLEKKSAPVSHQLLLLLIQRRRRCQDSKQIALSWIQLSMKNRRTICDPSASHCRLVKGEFCLHQWKDGVQQKYGWNSWRRRWRWRWNRSGTNCQRVAKHFWKRVLDPSGKVPSTDETFEHTLHLDKRDQFCFLELQVFHTNVYYQVDSSPPNRLPSNRAKVEVWFTKFHQVCALVLEIESVWQKKRVEMDENAWGVK